MKRILLDTNSYSLFIKGDNLISKQIEKAELIFISYITVGELYAGFMIGNKFKDNEEIIKRFLNKKKVNLVEISFQTATIYGKITSELYKKGNPIPTNDIWIAAQVIETDSILITYDKHFLNIPNLKIWDRLKS